MSGKRTIHGIVRARDLAFFPSSDEVLRKASPAHCLGGTVEIALDMGIAGELALTLVCCVVAWTRDKMPSTLPLPLDSYVREQVGKLALVSCLL